jgi:hypothetical protein
MDTRVSACEVECLKREAHNLLPYHILPYHILFFSVDAIVWFQSQHETEQGRIGQGAANVGWSV